LEETRDAVTNNPATRETFRVTCENRITARHIALRERIAKHSRRYGQIALAGVASSRRQFALLNRVRNTDIFFMGPKKNLQKKSVY